MSNKNDLIIVNTRTLVVGDIVRPINACGPVAPVIRVDQKYFVVDLDDERGDTDSRLPRREVNALNPRTGKIPRLRREGEVFPLED